MESGIEFKIVSVPLVGRPTLSFHRGVYRAEREFQRMVDSGENERVTLWFGSAKKPYMRWKR